MKDNSDNKKKGGRPKKSAVNRKSRTIGVCFSEPELYTLKYRAKQAKLPLSIYCHDAILEAKIVEAVNKEDLIVLKSLSNMGNNLNQLVKHTRFLSLKDLENKTLFVLNSILEIIDTLSDDWKNNKRKKL
ncbi:hypothetical protein G7051_15695 [Dysgonomonas sp. HDW5B]|uniref:plasmid mobilization protein n=1 Tax=Dysgonomonas sp. HDW5B TaxID=2714927 RepID=UPI001407987F|nr:hypothetical protein [Dysgonomonas sp. HDW5B]QIK55713.1 hypothetical protein G7051_15695 [Dysgonomonas sp. HDW5B]